MLQQARRSTQRSNKESATTTDKSMEDVASVLDRTRGPPGGAMASAEEQPQAKMMRVGENGDADKQRISYYTHTLVQPDGSCSAVQERDAEAPAAQRMAKSFPFALDGFQKACIACVEQCDSTLVAAHTSAGKTAIAEYAIALCCRESARAIYTAPLKALSNQKYRALSEEFGTSKVGLMTGDVTLNPDASVVVMTTEVLRSMLYNNASVVAEAKWVVFDEIHYLRDPERGVVWEEAVSLLPSSTAMLFLSATVPNACEFAQWVAQLHSQRVHVVHTDARPVPLRHYVFPAGGDNLHLAVSEDGAFQDAQFQRAVATVTAADNSAGRSGRKSKKNGKKGQKGQPDDLSVSDDESDITKLARLVVERNADPAIFFSFSKKEVEANANKLGLLQLTDSDEVKLIDAIISSALDTLSEHDKKLSQISNVYPLLANGIGVHHGGMLPVLKELVEVLFQENLIKLLCATETFSTGLNMPCRTAVFTSCRKFDGTSFRWVTGGEYTQMSGRAGRRGLDERGVVILMLDTRMEPAIARDVLLGTPDPITSSFSLTYPMMLNLLRLETSSPETLVQRSFKQFQSQRKVPQLQAQAEELEHERDNISIENENQVADYNELSLQAAHARRELRELLNAPTVVQPFLQPGRLVRVLAHHGLHSPDEPEAFVWGVIVSFEKKSGAMSSPQEQSRDDYIVDTLVRCAVATANDGSEDGMKKKNPTNTNCNTFGESSDGIITTKRSGEPVHLVNCDDTSSGKARVVLLSLGRIDRLSTVRTYLSHDLRQEDACEKSMRMVSEIKKRFKHELPLLDPREDMQVDSDAYKQLKKRLKYLDGSLNEHPLANDDDRYRKLQELHRKQKLDGEVSELHKEVKAASGLVMQEELKCRRQLLERLHHVDSDGIVQRKGRAACEIASADALVASELLMDGTFAQLNAPSLCALVSCMVWGERRFDNEEEEYKLHEESKSIYRVVKDTAKRVGKAAASCGLDVDANEYANSFRPELMECLRSWADGGTFGNCMHSSGVFEGSLVRAIRRVEEILRQFELAAKALGDTALSETFAAASSSIRREVPFAPSLFL